jgi:HAD superfamily hydrolase (TIGR01509 family)
MTAGPDLVIFDCDGVLVDSERLSHTVLCELLAEQGVQLTLAQAVDRFIGSTVDGMLHGVSQLLGRPVPADFLDDFKARSAAAFTAGLQPVAGVPALLDALPYPYCVASNGNHAKVRFTLGHTGLLPLFEGRIFTADDVPRPKPAPDLFLHAARQLGAEPTRCVVVEDTVTGVRAARAAGMRAIGHAGLTPPQRLLDAGAEAVLAEMAQLAALLR